MVAPQAPGDGGAPMSDLGTYLGCLFGGEPSSSYAELRWKLRDRSGMGREFVPLGSRDRLARLIEARGRTTDLYLGVAPRPRQQGTRDAIERSHVLFVDCDTPESMAALQRFRPQPSMVIGSGTGQHAYWSMWPPVAPDVLEKANRRIAHVLGADMRATDAARVLRPPGTFNLKTGVPVPVVVQSINVEIFTAQDVAGALPDPPERASREPGTAGPRAVRDDPLLAIPPTVYVEALTGRQVGRDGKIACPFHEDRTPSLHVYPTVERGWCCHAGCGGGSVIDFGAKLYGIEPRGAGFHQIRERLEADLRGQVAA